MSSVVERLLELAVETGALTYGDFTLTSGKKSSYYFDGRLLSLDPEGAHLISQAVLPVLRDVGATAVGGPTLGADPIVASIFTSANPRHGLHSRGSRYLGDPENVNRGRDWQR